MRPKGWKLDQAWVEHYSKIERETHERQIARMNAEHKAWVLEMDKKSRDARKFLEETLL